MDTAIIERAQARMAAVGRTGDVHWASMMESYRDGAPVAVTAGTDAVSALGVLNSLFGVDEVVLFILGVPQGMEPTVTHAIFALSVHRDGTHRLDVLPYTPKSLIAGMFSKTKLTWQEELFTSQEDGAITDPDLMSIVDALIAEMKTPRDVAVEEFQAGAAANAPEILQGRSLDDAFRDVMLGRLVLITGGHAVVWDKPAQAWPDLNKPASKRFPGYVSLCVTSGTGPVGLRGTPVELRY